MVTGMVVTAVWSLRTACGGVTPLRWPSLSWWLDHPGQRASADMAELNCSELSLAVKAEQA